jgi:hypothetical protein
MFLNLIKHEYYFLFVIITICFVQLFESTTEVHYNIADPGWLILRKKKYILFQYLFI